MKKYLYDYQYKIVMVGDAGVGKEEIIKSFINDCEEDAKGTLGVELNSKIVEMDDQSLVKVLVCDMAGQERFGAVASMYLRGAVGALLTYSVTDRSSFESLNMWLEKLDEYAQQGVIILLLGNKANLTDEREESRQVSH